MSWLPSRLAWTAIEAAASNKGSAGLCYRVEHRWHKSRAERLLRISHKCEACMRA